MIKVGYKYVVALGKYRGHSLKKTEDYSAGYLPDDMLDDGTIVTIERDQGDGWCVLEERREYSYPIHLLNPLTPTRQLLKHIRNLNEHIYGT